MSPERVARRASESFQKRESRLAQGAVIRRGSAGRRERSYLEAQGRWISNSGVHIGLSAGVLGNTRHPGRIPVWFAGSGSYFRTATEPEDDLSAL